MRLKIFTIIVLEKKMKILGLMAIPPNDQKNTEKYFKSLSELNYSLGLKELSIGMSSDFMQAIKYKATYLVNRQFNIWRSILIYIYYSRV